MSENQPTEATGASAAEQDILIRGGTYFDGLGTAGAKRDVLVRGGKVSQVAENLPATGAREIDARGSWVMPGLLDIHTHYDAEVEVMPGLEESVRHGVTTVVMGNCSLSTALGSSDDILDLFCRVESLPRDLLASWIDGRITWNGLSDYYSHLGKLPIGPNVSSYLGHSSLRAHVMGMGRSLTVSRAEPAEIERMRGLTAEAMQEGYLGLSIDMLPWHRLDGERFRGISVPSQHAHPNEYRSLAKVVRRFNRVLQATPSAMTKSTIILLWMISTGMLRKPLRTTIVAAMDVKTDRKAWRIATLGAALFNRMFNADIRWQALAEPFLNFCDGVFTPLFEEFPTGVDAISATREERQRMFRDPKYRQAFRRDWESKGQKVFHRNMDEMWIVSSPIAAHVGKSFKKIADEQGAEPLELFMDLMAEHDSLIRWRTVVTNDRDEQRHYLFAHDTTIPGFNDSGAHNRNMAFQDGGLQMLQQVLLHPDVMPIEKAIHKLTRQSADWLGLDTGSLRPGDWADVAVIDPEKLKNGLSQPIELEDPRLNGIMRMVKRSDGVVRQVLVRGQVVFDGGSFVEDFGRRRYGRLLRSTRN